MTVAIRAQADDYLNQCETTSLSRAKGFHQPRPLHWFEWFAR